MFFPRMCCQSCFFQNGLPTIFFPQNMLQIMFSFLSLCSYSCFSPKCAANQVLFPECAANHVVPLNVLLIICFPRIRCESWFPLKCAENHGFSQNVLSVLFYPQNLLPIMFFFQNVLPIMYFPQNLLPITFFPRMCCHSCYFPRMYCQSYFSQYVL